MLRLAFAREVKRREASLRGARRALVQKAHDPVGGAVGDRDAHKLGLYGGDGVGRFEDEPPALFLGVEAGAPGDVDRVVHPRRLGEAHEALGRFGGLLAEAVEEVQVLDAVFADRPAEALFALQKHVVHQQRDRRTAVGVLFIEAPFGDVGTGQRGQRRPPGSFRFCHDLSPPSLGA